MGTDIHGVVEYQKLNMWRSVIDIDGLLSRNYEAFGYIAGVRNGSYDPMFPDRGIPDDASTTVVKRLEESGATVFEKFEIIVNRDIPEKSIEIGNHSYSYGPFKEGKSYVLPEQVVYEFQKSDYQYPDGSGDKEKFVEVGGFTHSHTYFSLEEVNEIDMSETISEEKVLHFYENGQVVHTERIFDDVDKYEDEVREGSRVIRKEKKQVRDIFSDDWFVFFRLMQQVADGFDLQEDQVRAVVWFDN